MPTIEEVSKFFKADHLTRPLIRYFYYPLAVLLSWIAVSLGIHAHFVNLLGLVSGLAAAWIIFYLNGKWMILAGILVLLGLVVDLSDGTVARFYNKKNAMGKWLDESTGFISFCVVFFAFMMRTFMDNSDIRIIVLGTYAIFSYMMINYAALLSEVLRKKFNLENPADNVRQSLSKTFLGINPSIFSFSLDIQWTLVALCIIFNAPYILFIIFGGISSIQWMSRYIIFFGK